MVLGKMTKLKTLKDLKIEEELCEKLDTEVYLPVKKELEGINRTYSLGFRKENFKGIIADKSKELKQEAIRHIKAGRKGIFLGATIEDYIMWYNNITEDELK